MIARLAALSKVLHETSQPGVSLPPVLAIGGGELAADAPPSSRKLPRLANPSRGLFAGLLLAAPAMAETLDLSGSTITMQASAAQGALAEIVFNNVNRNSPADQITARLTLADVEIGVRFGFNVAPGGADSITVIPPDGIICRPECHLVLQEGYAGTITLYSLEGVGM